MWPAAPRPRQVTSGDWGVSDIAWHPDGRTVAFTADRGSEAGPGAANHDLVRRRGRRTAARATRGPGAPAAGPTTPSYSPDGRWVAAIGVDERRAARRRQPDDPARPGRRQPRQPTPSTSRPTSTDPSATGSTPTRPAGWCPVGTGPWWLDDDDDRGRGQRPRPVASTSLPTRRSHRPAGRPPTPLDRRDHRVVAADRDPLAGRRRPATVASLATDGTRAMELATVTWLEPSDERPTLTHPLDRRLGLAAALRADRDAARPGARRRRPDRGLDLLARPAPADGPLPTVVDVHGGPLGAWAPTPHIEVHLLASAGYRVVLPNIRGSAHVRPRLDHGRSSATGAASMPRTSMPPLDHVIALGLADPDRLGVMGLSYGGFMVNWLVGTTDRFQAAVVGERRHQPDQRLGQLRQRPGVRPRVAARRPVLARRASTSSGASHRCATSRTSTRRCSCSRPRRTCAARPPTTSSSSSPCASSAGRSSTSSIRTSTTSTRTPAARTAGSTATSACCAWFDRYLRA